MKFNADLLLFFGLNGASIKKQKYLVGCFPVSTFNHILHKAIKNNYSLIIKSVTLQFINN